MTAASRTGGWSAAADARTRAPRHKVFEPVLLAAAGVTARAHLLNVSLTGALLHVAPPVMRGDRLTVALRGIWVPAQVVRVAGPRAGIAFERPLDAAQVDALLA